MTPPRPQPTPPLPRITTRAAGFAVFSFDGMASFEMEMHAHAEHELNLVLEGNGSYEFPGQPPLPVAAGQVMLMPAGHVHRLRVQGRLSFRGLLLHHDWFRVEGMAPWPGMPSPRLAQTADPLEPRTLVAPGMFQSLLELHGQAQLELGQSGAFERARYLAGLGQLGAIQLARLVRLDAAHGTMDAALLRVLRVKDWLDRNFGQATTLAQLAAMAHLSPSHFSALFSRHFGLAPKAYLVRRRLEQAALLLEQSGLSIIEIAFSVGFENLAHFNRQFKQHHGCAPGAWRKERRRG